LSKVTFETELNDEALGALRSYLAKRNEQLDMRLSEQLEKLYAATVPAAVRGYLGEQFEVLKHRYPHIQFLENPLFNEANNISSAWVARGLLQSAYVCEADLLLKNPLLIRKYEYVSNYLGRYTDYTDDWCFQVKGNAIRELCVGGTNCYHM